VFEREKITLAIGDRIRFTKNVKHRGQKFLNNELRTVVSIDDGKIISIKARLFALEPLCIRAITVTEVLKAVCRAAPNSVEKRRQMIWKVTSGATLANWSPRILICSPNG
jgi:hypothetical protein